MILLDTNLLIWLHDGNTERLTDTAKEAIESNTLLYSPCSQLEIQYLFERGRFQYTAPDTLARVHAELDIERSDVPLHRIINHSLDLSWTRDPFDRLIVANAIAEGVGIVTSDRIIRTHYDKAIW